MSLPSRRKGFGPAARSSSGITAYQKRRKTSCFVVSMWSSTPALMASFSSFPRDGAVVPRPKRQFRKPDGDQEQRYSGKRDQEQRREHARNFKLVAGLQNLIGEPGVAAAGAGDEFRHQRADQCEAGGYPQAREEVRQRARNPQVDQILQTRRPIDGEQILVSGVDAAQAHGGVRDDGKDRDDGGA